MSLLSIVYKGAKSNTLYTASFDGTSWQGNTKISDQPGRINAESNRNPGTCIYKDQFFMAYKGANSNDLYLASFDGHKWHGNQKIGDVSGLVAPKSTESPSLVVYRGLMYLIYKGEGTNNIYVAWYDGNQWYGDLKIYDLPGGIDPLTNHAPKAITFNNRLYLIYKGQKSNTLFSAFYDGYNWYGNTKIEEMEGYLSAESSDTPTPVIYNGLLYLIYKGANSDDIFTCAFNGAEWEGNVKISEQPGGIAPKTNYGPGAIEYNNKLYLIYKGNKSDDYYSAWYDGQTWKGNVKLSQLPGNIAPQSNYNPQPNFFPVAPRTQATWLSKLPDTIKISDISLPGTHDSAAINAYTHTPYANHHLNITEQLQAGIRLLDVRLKVKKENNSFVFVTAHGSFPFNEFQSFSSLLNECREFLDQNQSEFISILLKIDDWNCYNSERDDVFKALKAQLLKYPIFEDPYLPDLEEVRGKIYLLNRIDHFSLGVPINWDDNTEGQMIAPKFRRSFSAYVQDKYKGLALFYPKFEKLDLFTHAIRQFQPGELLLNFASATFLGDFGIYIMPEIINYLGANVAEERPAYLGWTLMDYATNQYQTDIPSFVSCVDLIISANFDYEDFQKTFMIVRNGQNGSIWNSQDNWNLNLQPLLQSPTPVQSEIPELVTH